ncbi:sporulation protein YunB [Bacillus sp. B15-48]|nr:sporulation protein YunB [Bacillus sp. B15-48]
MLATLGGLWIIDRKIEPILMRYAEAQSTKMATLIINKAINEQVVRGMNTTDLIEYVPINDGSKTVIQYNAEVLNKIKAETVSLIQANINEAEKGNFASLQSFSDVDIEPDAVKREEGLVYYIPLGRATNNLLLANQGPSIPVRFTAIGDIVTDVVWEQKPLGINNTWIDVSIQVVVNVQVIIPFATTVATVKENIPIGGFLHEGEVPQFFNNGGGGAPAIPLPTER